MFYRVFLKITKSFILSLLWGGAISARASQNTLAIDTSCSDLTNWFVGLETGAVFLSPTGTHSELELTQSAASHQLGTFNVTSGVVGSNMGIFVGYSMQNKHQWFSNYRFNLEATHTLLAPTVEGSWSYPLHAPANKYLIWTRPYCKGRS